MIHIEIDQKCMISENRQVCHKNLAFSRNMIYRVEGFYEVNKNPHCE